MKDRTNSLAPLILVIEDQVDWSESLQGLLVHEGYRTAGARDGVEGMMLAEALSPDLIIVTLALPVMDGIEFLQHYSRSSHVSGVRAPVIALTGISAYLYQALDLGVESALRLPVSQDLLLDTVVSILTHRNLPGAPGRETINPPRAMDSPALSIEAWQLEQLLQMLRVDTVSVGLICSGGVHFRLGTGFQADEWRKHPEWYVDSPCQLVLNSAQWLGIGDLAVNPLFRSSRWRSDQGLRSYSGTPILSGDGQMVGTLAVHGRKPRIFQHAEKRILQAFAERIGMTRLSKSPSQEWLFRVLPALVGHAAQNGRPLSVAYLEGEDLRLKAQLDERVSGLPWQVFAGSDPLSRSWLLVGYDMDTASLRGWSMEIAAGMSSHSIRVISSVDHGADSATLLRELHGHYFERPKDRDIAA